MSYQRMVLFFILVLVFKMDANGQENEVKELDASFVALIVVDIDRSIEWYKEVLNFEIINQNVNEDLKFTQVNLKSGNNSLELIQLPVVVYTEDILAKAPKGSRVSGFYKVGFTVSDFDFWYEHLKKKETNIHGKVVVNSITGKRMVIVLDPDGNRIQIFEK